MNVNSSRGLNVHVGLEDLSSPPTPTNDTLFQETLNNGTSTKTESKWNQCKKIIAIGLIGAGALITLAGVITVLGSAIALATFVAPPATGTCLVIGAYTTLGGLVLVGLGAQIWNSCY